MPPRRFNNQQEARIISAYQSGMDIYPIATRYKCSSPTVRNVLVKNNIELRKRKKIKDMLCAHTGCKRHRQTGKHCAGHYNQQRRTGKTWDFKPAVKRKSNAEIITGFLKEYRAGFNERIQERLDAQEI